MGAERGLVTNPLISPLKAFDVPPSQREPIPLPPTQPGFCELCRLPLKPGEVKFHRDLHGWSCKEAFYRLCRQQAVFIVPRELLIRRLRPRGKGQPMPGVAKDAQREIRQHIDDLEMRMRDAADRLAEKAGQ